MHFSIFFASAGTEQSGFIENEDPRNTYRFTLTESALDDLVGRICLYVGSFSSQNQVIGYCLYDVSFGRADEKHEPNHHSIETEIKSQLWFGNFSELFRHNDSCKTRLLDELDDFIFFDTFFFCSIYSRLKRSC